MVERVTASVFHRFATSGRTSPIISTCLTREGQDVDVYLKLNGAMEFGTRGAAFELVGSLMAIRLGIDCPRPLLVFVTDEFIDVVEKREPAKAMHLRNSRGWNFGSEQLKDVVMWLNGAPIPPIMLQDAGKIYCFDGLTQNVDRRPENPNLMTHGERLAVIDHECAFTFLSSVIPSAEPWRLGSGDFMERHALRSALKDRSIDWAVCRESLSRLTDDFFESVEDSLPREWKASRDLAAIRRHVTAVVEHFDLFQVELQRRIA